jgi:CBS domain-containing protein
MLTVQDVMTTKVVTAHRETPLKDVARSLVRYRISGVVIVDDTSRVLGVVSEADLLIKESGETALPHRRGARILGESRRTKAGLAKVRATTAGEAMTSPAVTVGPEESISAAAILMVERSINRLPVTRAGRLVGIVSRADLVRAYVRTDEQLAASIRHDVLLRHLLIDPAAFDVHVHQGVVTIRGQAETRTIADMIDALITALPGVIAVRADVSWLVDDRRSPPLDPDALRAAVH